MGKGQDSDRNVKGAQVDMCICLVTQRLNYDKVFCMVNSFYSDEKDYCDEMLQQI